MDIQFLQVKLRKLCTSQKYSTIYNWFYFSNFYYFKISFPLFPLPNPAFVPHFFDRFYLDVSAQKIVSAV